MIATVALALLALQQPQPDAAEQRAFPPRAPIDGLAGLRIHSRLTPPGEDEPTQSLHLIYNFPQRARLQLMEEGAPSSERDLVFQLGSEYWALSPNRTRSRGLDALESPLTPLHLELRRALWLWPAGFEWSGAGNEREAALALEAPHCEVGAWTLMARLGTDGRPTEMAVLARDSDVAVGALPRFENVTWNTDGKRAHPATLELWRADRMLWSERVERVDTNVNMLDHYFLPHDRKGEREPSGYRTPWLTHLPPAVVLRVELEGEQPTWEAALAACDAARRRATHELAGRGLELRDERVLELDRSGRARAIVLRLEGESVAPPEGWELVPGREAVTQRRPAGEPVRAASLDGLRRLVPRGARHGTPWARLATGSDGEPTLQLVLPFER